MTVSPVYRGQMDEWTGLLREGFELEESKQGKTPIFKKAEAEKPTRKLRCSWESRRKIRLTWGESTKTNKNKNQRTKQTKKLQNKHFNMVSRVALVITRSQATLLKTHLKEGNPVNSECNARGTE